MKKSLATLGVLAAAALALSGCTDSAASPDPPRPAVTTRHGE